MPCTSPGSVYLLYGVIALWRRQCGGLWWTQWYILTWGDPPQPRWLVHNITQVNFIRKSLCKIERPRIHIISYIYINVQYRRAREVTCRRVYNICMAGCAALFSYNKLRRDTMRSPTPSPAWRIRPTPPPHTLDTYEFKRILYACEYRRVSIIRVPIYRCIILYTYIYSVL